MSSSSPKLNYDIQIMTGRHRDGKADKNKKPALFLTKQFWSPRHKISVLSTCGGCYPKRFIVASFYELTIIKIMIIIMIIIILLTIIIINLVVI